ncbi:glycosyltransferase family 2 protein [Arundinibacter roseus]|uniref:Glycosyltransferase n=1 Tax=Arundinibacter roseus TaxID=2070510 RepID=A0A4R4K0H4_9BACT|nr:glycosyltransferase [Arundinibacter roseus]TDB59801.1 glycosyltransferase [Arundinibacter roseus]
MISPHTFPTVTLLITHYNRSASLERLLKAFSDLRCQFGSIVVSDDGSQPEHQRKLSELQRTYFFKLVSTPKNRGLGNNLNKGQDAVNTPLTLYVQEDFVPTELFPSKLKSSIKFMQQDPSLDMVRYYAYFKYPYLRPLAEGFSYMRFSLLSWGYQKFYVYSDHPHLRRSSFFAKFGRYIEGRKGDVTEYQMMMSFLTKKGKALFYEDFQDLFIQKNSEDEPSTMKRNMLRESDQVFIVWARHLYRHLKFNADYVFFRG